MASNAQHSVNSSVRRLFGIIKLERREISAIYFYAVLFGLLQLTLPLGIQSIINFVLAGSFSTSMVVLIALVTTGVFFTGLLQVNQMKLNEKIQQNLFVQYAFEFAYRIPKLDLNTLDRYYLPEQVNRFFDIVGLQKGIGKLLLDIPVATIQIVFGLLLLSFYNAIFIFFGILLIIILFVILKYSSRNGLSTSIEESDYKYKVAAWLQELARVMPSFKFSQDTNLHLRKTDGYVQGYLIARTKHFKILLIQYWALIFFKVFITLVMLVVGGFLLVDQRLNVGQFVAAEIVIIMVLSSVEKFIISLDKMYDVLTSVEKLGKMMDKPLETEGSLELLKEDGIQIKIQDLSFAYNGVQPVLSRVNLEVPRGAIVTISGHEGSGKSTLLRMLSGAYSQFDGQILFNDIPIGNYNKSSLRSQIGIAFNQQEIFEGSLWENISLGNSSYTVAEIMVLAKKIGLDGYIARLSNGFDTVLDPFGRRLNKTTTQKILILRALACKPSLLLLEEPGEGMDEESKAQIVSLLTTELKGVTTLIATNDKWFKQRGTSHFVLVDGRLSKADVV